MGSEMCIRDSTSSDRRHGHPNPHESPRGSCQDSAASPVAGIPVVSYDIDGAREVCIDGETGYLVTAGDTQTLARRLIDLSRAPELRKKLGMRGQSFCRERFSHHVMTDKIRGIYQKLLTDQDVSQLPSEN